MQELSFLWEKRSEREYGFPLFIQKICFLFLFLFSPWRGKSIKRASAVKNPGTVQYCTREYSGEGENIGTCTGL